VDRIVLRTIGDVVGVNASIGKKIPQGHHRRDRIEAKLTLPDAPELPACSTQLPLPIKVSQLLLWGRVPCSTVALHREPTSCARNHKVDSPIVNLNLRNYMIPTFTYASENALLEQRLKRRAEPILERIIDC
jgi:hypothetical protein